MFGVGICPKYLQRAGTSVINSLDCFLTGFELISAPYNAARNEHVLRNLPWYDDMPCAILSSCGLHLEPPSLTRCSKSVLGVICRHALARIRTCGWSLRLKGIGVVITVSSSYRGAVTITVLATTNRRGNPGSITAVTE